MQAGAGTRCRTLSSGVVRWCVCMRAWEGGARTLRLCWHAHASTGAHRLQMEGFLRTQLEQHARGQAGGLPLGDTLMTLAKAISQQRDGDPEVEALYRRSVHACTARCRPLLSSPLVSRCATRHQLCIVASASNDTIATTLRRALAHYEGQHAAEHAALARRSLVSC